MQLDARRLERLERSLESRVVLVVARHAPDAEPRAKPSKRRQHRFGERRILFDEVAGHEDEVRPQRLDLGDPVLDPSGLQERSDVQVGELRDAQAVVLGAQALDGHHVLLDLRCSQPLDERDQAEDARSRHGDRARLAPPAGRQPAEPGDEIGGEQADEEQEERRQSTSSRRSPAGRRPARSRGTATWRSGRRPSLPRRPRTRPVLPRRRRGRREIPEAGEDVEVHQRPHREDGHQKRHDSALVVHVCAVLLSLLSHGEPAKTSAARDRQRRPGAGGPALARADARQPSASAAGRRGRPRRPSAARDRPRGEPGAGAPLAGLRSAARQTRSPAVVGR